MAGRRLLDAAKLWNASRSILRHHLDLRHQQFDAYTKTSTLAKAIKDQTDRVTLTAKAAIALSERLNATDDNSRGFKSKKEEVALRPEAENTRSQADPIKEGIEQDHHYEASERNTIVDRFPTQELRIQQEEAGGATLPDGTQSPATYVNAQLLNNASVKEEKNRENKFSSQLGQHDWQLPTQVLEPRLPDEFKQNTPLAAEQTSNLQKLSESQTYTASSGTKALQEEPSKNRGPNGNSGLEKGSIPQDINLDIFHSQKIAKMLGGGVQKGAYGLNSSRSSTKFRAPEEEKLSESEAGNVTMTENANTISLPQEHLTPDYNQIKEARNNTTGRASLNYANTKDSSPPHSEVLHSIQRAEYTILIANSITLERR